MIVYVINKDNRPLMPTNSRKARLLLKEGKAKIYKYEPFTIQLIYGSYGYTQPSTLGIDAGSKNIGVAAVTDQGKVLYTANIELRQDIKENLATRKMLRGPRRSRKTRYRPCRNKRKKGKGWLAPSIRSKIQSHIKQVTDICKILPISNIKVEVGLFDVQAILDPDIKGKEYQNGILKGYDSKKEYVKVRDKYICMYKDLRQDITCSPRLEVDHMDPKSRGGSDRVDNLICSCSEHNRIKSNQTYKEFTGKKNPKVKSFKETPFMNYLEDYLVPLLEKIKSTTITYGYITRKKRLELGLEKSHINDAITITEVVPKEYIGNSYQIRQVRKKKRSLHQMTPYSSKKGNLNQVRLKKNTKEKVVSGMRWSLWDKVKIKETNQIGFISGFGAPSFNIKSIAGEKFCSINAVNIKLICKNNNWVSLSI